jgi:hypothetical protein
MLDAPHKMQRRLVLTGVAAPEQARRNFRAPRRHAPTSRFRERVTCHHLMTMQDSGMRLIRVNKWSIRGLFIVEAAL